MSRYETMKSRGIMSAVLCVLLGACGSDGGNGESGGGADGGSDVTPSKSTGEGPCESPSECEGGVCVALIDGNHPPEYCTQECGSCPDGFYCDADTFALAGLSFCRFGNTPDEPPPPPQEPPRLPCKSDAECGEGLVCATYMGESDCTLPCSNEEQCTITLGGFIVDMNTCDADQTPGETRDVCLPDPACFPDATSCIQFPF